MHSLPEVIAEMLRERDAASNPVQNASWPLFVGQLDTDPDEAIGVYDVATPMDGRIHRTGETIGLPGYQVRVRSKDYARAREKAFDIADIFDAILRERVVVENDLYEVQGVHQQSSRPSYIGPDPNNRQNFTINGTASYRKVI